MQTLNDVHQQFASFFKSETLQPFAYLVYKKLNEGHICLDLEELELVKENLPVAYKATNLTQNILAESLIGSIDNKQPFIKHNNKLYLQRYFNYETIILEKVIELTNIDYNLINSRKEQLIAHRTYIQKLFDLSSSTDQTNWQLVAAITGVLNNFTIITGGPGTGKTTTVAKILAILFILKPDLKVALAAPTGKAAARMAESLKAASTAESSQIDAIVANKFQDLEPSTLHRLLGYIKDSTHFKHHSQNTMNFDVVIVDESSMIDVALFAKLLDAIGKETRIILLGDKNQLASVEAGSLFGDLCESQKNLNLFSKENADFINSFIDESSQKINKLNIQNPLNHPLFQHVIELQFSHRFKSDEGIGKFSKAVIQNQQHQIKEFLSSKDDAQVSIDTRYSKSIFDEFIKGFENYINESDIKKALQLFNELRILCAIREGENGLYAINRKVEKYLYDKNLINQKTEFYNNRPIIVTQNNYALDLFNGDVGIIREDKDGTLKAWFEDKDGKVKSVLAGLISKVETVFAMTIHKSQGSEFNSVLVILPAQEDIELITRELLYTAVTRAKNKVIIQSSETVLLKSADAQVQRASGITDRFLEDISNK
jgi:exodeoxyribonuclease V alpha subunit